MLWGVSITKLANAVITLRRASLQEKYETLFDAWDTGKTGSIKFMKIEKGLQRLKASSDELHVEFVSEAAFKALPSNAQPDTHMFDRDGFKQFAERLVLEMDQPFGVVAELLLLGALELQPRQAQELSLLKEIKGKVDEEARTAEQQMAMSEDPTISSLFVVFNLSGSGRLTFQEVAHMLHRLRQDISLRQARAEAVNLMLLLDTDSERSLDKVAFARFLQKLSTLMCMDIKMLAEILLDIAKHEEPRTLDDAATALMMETQNPISQVYETLSDRKLHLLFELWDKDADGTISFAEVALGLRKFCHESEPASETAADAAETLLIFDADSDQRLDWADFARFINQFCDACGAEFSSMSEYLILLAALDDNPTEELAFLLSEDKVERAILGVDNLWRKDIVSEPRASEEIEAKASVDSSNSTQRSGPLKSLISNVSQGMQSMSIEPSSQGGEAQAKPQYERLELASSEQHQVQASPFGGDGDGGEGAGLPPRSKAPQMQTEKGSDGHKKTDQKGSQMPGLSGLKSLKSKLSYRH